ncbi:MAG TPA: hypothetical protein VH025_03055 [Solirubrobacteraceae bacterium]|nr:hypothetical protein [Solirubrobacteraceae bacterium]
MSTQEQTIEQDVPEVAPDVETETAPAAPVSRENEPTLSVEFGLAEAEALYGWLMKPANDGSTAIEDPLVSRSLAKIRDATDVVRAAVNIRVQLQEVGLAAEHLSDEDLRELAGRLSQAAAPSLIAA